MSRGGGLSHYADQRVQRERAAEQKQAGLQRLLQEQRRARAQSQSDQRVERLRQQRQEASERRELWRDHQFVKSAQERARKNHLEDCKERLADQLHLQKAKAAREEAERQRICDGSEELRALKSRLAAAATNKMRAMQLVQRQAQDHEEDQRQATFLSQLEERRLRELELEHQLQQEKQNQRMLVKNMNQDQIAEKQRMSQENGAREYMRDKAQVDELVARICAEDRAETDARRARVTMERKVIEDHRQERQAQNEALRKWEADQDARIEDFARRKREEEEELARVREQQEQERRRMLYAMLDGQLAQKREADNRQRILDEYHQEQRLEEQRKLEEEQVQKRAEDRLWLRQAWDEAHREKEERHLQKEEEERCLREELMAKFAEDARLEQMSDQKRRMKILEHRREVDRQVQQRREAYEQARRQELEDHQRAQLAEQERVRIIEEERQRLISQAAPLRDHFPKGVYEQETDLALVGEQLPPRPSGESRPRSLGRPSSQTQLRGYSVSNGAPLRAASLGPGRPSGVRHQAWGAPPAPLGVEVPGPGNDARQPWRPRILGGAGLSI